jgi:hypothetical protein
MFFKLRRQFAQSLFNRSTRAVLETPPLVYQPESQVTVVSQIHPPDLLMYLVAIKTFARFVPPRKVIVIGDRLSKADQDIADPKIEEVVAPVLDKGKVTAYDNPIYIADAALYLIERIMPRVVAKVPSAKLFLVGNAPPPEINSKRSWNRAARASRANALSASRVNLRTRVCLIEHGTTSRS